VSRRTLTGVLVSLVAGALVVAGATRGSGTSSVTDPGAESIILTVGLTVFGIAALLLLLTLLVALRGAPAPGVPSKPSDVPWWQRLALFLGAMTMVGLLVLALVLSLHPHRHLIKPQPAGITPAPPTPVVQKSAVHFSTGAFGVTVVVLVVLVLGFIAWRHFRKDSAEFRGHLEELSQPVSVIDDSPGIGREPVASVGPQEPADPYGEIDPRRAVMLAYDRFVYLMADAGMPRDTYETPTEFSCRLGRAPSRLPGPAASAAGDLAALFNLARYSDGPLPSEARTAALGDLEAIEQTIGAAR
jgi:hypothetical protein